MEFQAFQQHVAEYARQAGVEDYELYYQSAEGTRVSTYRQEVNEFSSTVEGGVCLRCIAGGRMGYASTEELSREAARELVRRAVDNAAVLESDEPAFLGQGGQSYQDFTPAAVGGCSAGELIQAALDTQAALYAAHPSVVDGASTQALWERDRIAIVNSRGLDLHYENTVSALVAAAVVAEAGEMTDAYEMKLGAVDQLDKKALAERAVEKARAKLGGDAAPTGVWPVVFAPEAMASLLATFSPVFSSDQAQKGLSRLAGKEGEHIASAAVTLVDDPFCPLSAMPIPFDAEGTPARKKNVVEGGRLNTLLYNHRTAAVAGKETTGNAAKAGYAAPVEVAPFAFYLAPGEQDEAALLRQAGRGVYIDSLAGLHAGANVVSGDFSLQSAGFLIEDGVKTTPVKAFTVAGNFYELLEKVTAVAGNLDVPNPGGITCFGSPSVLVDGLSIAGK